MTPEEIAEMHKRHFKQMWGFLQKYGQKANIPALKGYVADLIKMATQKTGGQPQYAKKGDIYIAQELEITMMSIVIEAVALVLSGELDKLEDREC